MFDSYTALLVFLMVGILAERRHCLLNGVSYIDLINTVGWERGVSTIRIDQTESNISMKQPQQMGDYPYTELSYKITSLISRICCLGSSGLTNTYADAGVMPFRSDSYRNITTKLLLIHFNNLFLFL